MADIFELFKKISKPKEAPAPPEFLLVGLGNPGRDYAQTRHNAGFLAIERICRQNNAECNRVKFHSLVGDMTIGTHRTLLMMPQTYMNASGNAVREAADFYKIPPERIIVIVDDINLDVGHMRIRRNGTDGGHNGLKSIIYMLDSDCFPRIRLGVGKKPSKDYDLAAWVTGRMPKEDLEAVGGCLDVCADAAKMIMENDFQGAMGKYNGMACGANKGMDKGANSGTDK